MPLLAPPRIFDFSVGVEGATSHVLHWIGKSLTLESWRILIQFRVSELANGSNFLGVPDSTAPSQTAILF